MPHDTPLLVADSFRVRESPSTGLTEARGLQLHLERFRASAISALTEVAPSGLAATTREQLDSFISEAPARIAAYGAGWPRLELWGSPEDRGASVHFDFRLALRPLPELGETLSYRTHDGVARFHPERKGPNIAEYAALNRDLGAEALFTDADGAVIEGSTTSLLWWRGDTLSTSASVQRVPSVTERLILDHARSRGVTIRVSSDDCVSLTDSEVWGVNALHGIRTVSHIDGVVLPHPNLDRLQDFQSALESTWEPVHVPG